jgi:hypothetical protein
MDARRSARSLVKSAFPGRDATIDLGFRDQPTFRELCQDYRDCAAALENSRRLKGDHPSSRTEEYASLLVELAKEIELWLDSIENGAAPLRGGGAR